MIILQNWILILIIQLSLPLETESKSLPIPQFFSILKQFLTRMCCFSLFQIDHVLSFTTKYAHIIYIYDDKQFLLFSLVCF
jgi:hypothetical protein